jgi:AcrR family transcriptional regulator
MTKVIDKRSAILNTALGLLVENGFHNTPMSLIAKQAGVSAGIIYHYFESKDDLIHQLYQEVEARFAAALVAGEPQQLEATERVRQVWLSAYKFYISHPQETLFMEQYKNSPFYKHEMEISDEAANLLAKKVQEDMAEGKIAELPMLVFYDLTLGVAMALAKQQIAGSTDLDQATLHKVADAICRAIQPA